MQSSVGLERRAGARTASHIRAFPIRIESVTATCEADDYPALRVTRQPRPSNQKCRARTFTSAAFEGE